MGWAVVEHWEFAKERSELPDNVLDKLAEVIMTIEQVGPNLGRPWVDTLKGSKHKNMKEIRCAVQGAWRFAFAFDPERRAVVLVGGNKEGGSSSKFYKQLIATADKRFDEWLEAEE